MKSCALLPAFLLEARVANHLQQESMFAGEDSVYSAEAAIDNV
jgi:hypothetical protein